MRKPHAAQWLVWLLCMMLGLGVGVASAQPQSGTDYLLGPGDVVRVSVFQIPDLTTEVRVSESGSITFPLIGNVAVGGQSMAAAEKLIAEKLKAGGFVAQPQVTMLLVRAAGSQVSVLGQVNRPGRFPIEIANYRLTDALAIAGGITASGADQVTLIGMRDGKQTRIEVDLPAMIQQGKLEQNVAVLGGDLIYVHRAPLFYIHGEAQRPGAYRLERDMTVRHALAQGGGVTLRGTERGLRVYRKGSDGKVQMLEPSLDEPIQADDVVYVRESLF